MRMTAAEGVSSPKRGINSGGSNSDGGSSTPVARRGDEDEGERGGVLSWLVKERMGGGVKKGRGSDEAALLYRRVDAALCEWGPARDGATRRRGGGGPRPDQ
jgi:hypothetical protein